MVYQSDNINNMVPTGPGHVSIIDVQINNKTAFVSWNMKSQEVCSGDVVNYTVFYGTQNEPQLSESTMTEGVNFLWYCINSILLLFFF